MADSHGLAIYFPETKMTFELDPDHTGYLQENDFQPVDFVYEHNWDEVISTGLYGVVRHPMYLAVTIMVIFSALALGSYWALIPAVLFPLVRVARILNEEKVLRRDLKGYAAYCATVRYRLIPGFW